jgi:hypothetical protein
MTSLRSPHPPSHPQHPAEAAMKNPKQTPSATTTTRAARMAALTRIAVLVLEAAIVFAMFREAEGAFEREREEYIAGAVVPAGSETGQGDLKRLAAAGVPPPLPPLLMGVGAVAHTEEVSRWS